MPQVKGSAGFVAGFLPGITASRIELLGREGNSGEYLAGILGAAGIVAAFLDGDAVVQHGHDKLCIPLQTNNGELAQGDEHPLPISGEHQILIEKPADGGRNLADSLSAAAFAPFLYAGTEDHGIQDLHCGHQFDRRN